MDTKFTEEKDYVHCLRVQIYPDEYAEERIASISSFAKKHHIQNITLFFNAEQFNVGHMTKEEFNTWLPTLKKARDAFLKDGFTVSLNPWIEAGHTDYGRKLKPGQNFQTMVDRYGKKCDLVACYLDPEWRKYYIDLMTYYVKELNPSVLWIEDDFRLHNHAPLDWGGCFCPIHMKRYCEKLGKEETRDEFVSHLEEREPTPERKAWLDVEFETMEEMAKLISENIKKLNVQTSVGLMSSQSIMHMMEGRHWHKLQEDLSPDCVLIDRIHLPVYAERTGKDYLYDFNMNSMVNRFFLGDDVKIYPECECDPFNPYIKNSRFITFQNDTALALGLDGMTYDVFDFTGNGANDEDGIGDAITCHSPYYNKVKELKIRPSQLVGPVAPVYEDTVYHRKNPKDFWTLLPDELNGFCTLASFGISYSFSQEKKWQNRTVILTGQNVNNLSDEELKCLFKDNHVILDGEAALFLKEKGLLSLIHASDATFMEADTGQQTNEEILFPTYRGMHRYRISARKSAGDFVSIQYDSRVKLLTRLNNYTMQFMGNGMAYTSSFFVQPYVLDHKCIAQFDPLRKDCLVSWLKDQEEPFALSQASGVYAYLYRQENRYVLFLVNSTVEQYPRISFLLHKIPLRRISQVTLEGKIQEVSFLKEGETVNVNCSLDYLSTATLILE